MIWGIILLNIVEMAAQVVDFATLYVRNQVV